MYTVYMHVNKTNGKKYVGITSQKPQRRWQKGAGYRKYSHLWNSFKKYGWDGFDHIILYENLTKEQAEKIEIQLIASMHLQDPNLGYNVSKGGDLINGDKDYQNKTVFQYSLDGTYVNTYINGTSASDQFNGYQSKISACARKEQARAYGYIWRYENDGYIEGNDLDQKELDMIATNSHPERKPVRRYSKDGSYVVFPSVSDGAKSVNGNPQDVSRCCLHQRPTYMGYTWEYENPVIYKIYQYTKQGDLINIYDSVKEASKQTGVGKQNIRSCYLGRQKTAGGYKWIRK